MKKTPKTIALMLTLSLIASSGCNIVRETETSARGSSETETTTTEEPTTTTESEETGSSKESESEASSSATESAPEETKETGIKGIKEGSIIETLEDPSYIIIKGENGEWIELAEGTVYYLTKAGNKVYYADKYTLKCIDITDPDLKENTLFKFYKWHNDEYDCEEILNISHAVVVGNTMYFGYYSFAAGTEDTDGVLKIDLDAGSLDEAEQLIPVADFGWKISEKEKAIFYCDGSERSSYQTLYRYDLATGDKTQVMKGVRSFDIQDGKILILSDDGLKLMDLKSGDIQTVTENDGWTLSGNLWGYAELHNGDVYYLEGNHVFKYDNGKTTTVLKIDSEEVRFFDFLYNDVIRIIYEESDYEYFVNGEKITDLKDITDITVKMKDGKSKDLSMTDFYVSE
ncbi:MAG: hypothetical protein J5715_02880 [Clostridiales bacterium]|nr:hypothetical protein [Clostridiales bacterium]